MSTYSNGWGHLLVTLAVLAMGTFLIYTSKLDTAAVTALLGPTISFWFMSGSINRFAAQTGASNATTNPTQQ